MRWPCLRTEQSPADHACNAQGQQIRGRRVFCSDLIARLLSLADFAALAELDSAGSGRRGRTMCSCSSSEWTSGCRARLAARRRCTNRICWTSLLICVFTAGSVSSRYAFCRYGNAWASEFVLSNASAQVAADLRALFCRKLGESADCVFRPPILRARFILFFVRDSVGHQLPSPDHRPPGKASWLRSPGSNPRSRLPPSAVALARPRPLDCLPAPRAAS